MYNTCTGNTKDTCLSILLAFCLSLHSLEMIYLLYINRVLACIGNMCKKRKKKVQNQIGTVKISKSISEAWQPLPNLYKEEKK